MTDLAKIHAAADTGAKLIGGILPKSWSNIGDPVVPLDRNLYGHSLAELLWDRQFEEVLLELGWEKSTELGMSVCSPKTRIVLV